MCGCPPLVTRMELNDANLQTLTEFLRKTLDPDPAIRRPGKEMQSFTIRLCILVLLLFTCPFLFLKCFQLKSFWSLWRETKTTPYCCSRCWRSPRTTWFASALLSHSRITSKETGELWVSPCKTCNSQATKSVDIDNGYWWNQKLLDCYLHCLYPAFESFLKVEDEPNKVSDPDRTAIKANIINLMLTSPEQIQKQVQPPLLYLLKKYDAEMTDFIVCVSTVERRHQYNWKGRFPSEMAWPLDWNGDPLPKWRLSHHQWRTSDCTLPLQEVELTPLLHGNYVVILTRINCYSFFPEDIAMSSSPMSSGLRSN